MLKLWSGKLIVLIQNQDALVLDPHDINGAHATVLPVNTHSVELAFNTFQHELYFFSNLKAQRINPDMSVTVLKDPTTGGDLRTNFLSFVSKDRYFYNEDNKRLFEIRDGRKQQVPLKNLGNTELRSIVVQDSTHLLLGTNQGLFQIREKNDMITHLEEPEQVRETDIRIRRRILPWKKDKWLLLGFPYAYFYGTDGSFSPIVPNTVSSYEGVLDGDQLFMGTEGGGLVRMDLNHPKYDVIDHGPLIPTLRYIALLHDNGSDSIFIGTRDSLMVYDKAKGTGAVVWKRSGIGAIRTILRDPDDMTWWIGTEAGLLHMDRAYHQLAHFKQGPGSISGSMVSDLLIERRTGRLWVAHDNGVDILDRRKEQVIDHVPFNLFTNPRVTSIQQDGKNRIWISTYSGLIGFDPGTRAYVKLGRDNGLINTEFNYTSSAILPDGRLIFGGLNGYDILRTTDFDFTMSRSEGQFSTYALLSPADTIFKTFNAQVSERIEFNVDKERLRIYLSARNRPDAALYRYEYNLDGENWIPVKGSPFIDLLNLEPDEYTLQVRAYNEFGTVITFPSLKVVASEPFLKSKSFIRILLVVLALLVGLYIFMLLNQRKREQDLKEKIAMDLHDEVGTILTRTLYLTRASAHKEDKTRVEQFLNEALYSLRAYIHTMNRSDLTLGQLRDEVNDLLSTTMRSAGYEADIDFRANEAMVINPELYRDVKLSVYEIMTNTIRHARGDKFTLRMKEEQGMLYISTCDNGVLADVAQIQDKGNGVRNLFKRVKRHRGDVRFAICSGGHGLQINLTLSIGS